MEIVLQWLDELDDVVFAGFSLWQRLRRTCLAVGLATAVSLHALPRLGLLIGYLPVLLFVSLASIALWSLVATLSASTERYHRRIRDSA